MTNIELIMNPYIAPVYVTATNMVMPIVTISNEAIAHFIVNLATRVAEIFRNFVFFANTVKSFMWREIIKNYNNSNINYDNLFITGIMMCFIGVMIYNKFILNEVYYNPLEQKIRDLEQQINVMKKQERMRENDMELVMQSQSQGFKQLQAEVDKKFKNYEKQMKKMDKEIKMYE